MPNLDLLFACTQASLRCSAPASIAFLASRPSGVLAATAARSMSPVARWHRQLSFLIAGLWVPLPEPGGPAQRKGGQRAAACECAAQPLTIDASNTCIAICMHRWTRCRHKERPGCELCQAVIDRLALGPTSASHR